jgi:hypothetical protein
MYAPANPRSGIAISAIANYYVLGVVGVVGVVVSKLNTNI